MKRSEPIDKKYFRPDIEGLRGLAVLFVVLFHAKFLFAKGGFLGVDVFFVLSGFLISRIILEGIGRGDFSLTDFYARRMRRILPAAMLMIFVVMILAIFLYRVSELVEVFKTANAATGYAANLHFLAQTADYFAADMENNPFLHMWSLAVEEQFYLIWPGLIVLVFLLNKQTQDKRKISLLFGGVLAISFVGASIHIGLPQAFFRADLRAWEFAAGALLALKEEPRLNLEWPRQLIVNMAGLLGLGFLLSAFYYIDGQPSAWLMLWPILGTCLVLWAGGASDRGLVSKCLSLRPLTILGRYSYSWYLWHWPLLVLAAPWVSKPSVIFNSIVVTVALGLAVLTYHLVEQPLRHKQGLVSDPKRTLLLGLGGTLGLMVLATGLGAVFKYKSGQVKDIFTEAQINGDDWSHIYTSGCKPRSGKDFTFCLHGDTASNKTVVLWGDSHGAHWFEAMDKIADQEKWRLSVALLHGCPPPATQKTILGCQNWREQVKDSLLLLKPQLVIIAYAHKYVPDPKWPKSKTIALDQWEAGLDSLVRNLEAARIPWIIVQDGPRFYRDPLNCLESRRGRIAPESCDTPKAQAFNQTALEVEEKIAKRYKGGRLLNLNSHLCQGATCQAQVGGRIRFRDTNHLVSAYAKSLAPHINEFIAQAGYLAEAKTP